MVHFKKVNFTLCKLYLNKAVVKTKFQGVDDGSKEMYWEHIKSSPNYYKRKKYLSLSHNFPRTSKKFFPRSDHIYRQALKANKYYSKFVL